jgi:hypothetical protein
MEQNDRMPLECPNPDCKQMLFYSRHDLRKTRQLVINCDRCHYRRTRSVDEIPELLSGLLEITLGDGERFDSQDITEAIAEQVSNTLQLTFTDGGRIEVHTDRLADDVDTLNLCRVRVVTL